MQIDVLSATGTGPTEGAAYQDALSWTGLADANLIEISGVIPAGSTIKQTQVLELAWGERLYVTTAASTTAVALAEVWSALGWVQDPESGKGFCVTASGGSEAEVHAEVAITLAAMTVSRGLDQRPSEIVTVGGRNGARAMCALVIASFRN